jgi:hypothetical protein
MGWVPLGVEFIYAKMAGGFRDRSAISEKNQAGMAMAAGISKLTMDSAPTEATTWCICQSL